MERSASEHTTGISGAESDGHSQAMNSSRLWSDSNPIDPSGALHLRTFAMSVAQNGACNLHVEVCRILLQSFGVVYKSNAACDRVIASPSPVSVAVLLCMD